MGTIKNFIEKIKSARYGKDVRQSIVDAIEQTYDDAIANGHTDMEVAKARGKHSSLSNRLEAEKNNMEEKIENEEIERKKMLENIQKQVNGLAKEGHLVASNITEMTDTNRTYINISDGHWYYYNGIWKDGGVYQAAEIENQSVDVDKTDFAKRINYFNKNSKDVVKDRWKGTATGGSIEGEGTAEPKYFMSNIIPCKAGDIIRFNKKGWNRNIMFANAQKIIISNIFSEDYLTGIIAPENAHYFRVLSTYDDTKEGKHFVDIIDDFVITINREIPNDKIYEYDDFELPKLNIIYDNIPSPVIKIPDDTIYNDLTNGAVIFTIDGCDEETYDAICSYANELNIPLTIFSGIKTNTLLRKHMNDGYNNCFGIYTSQPASTFEYETNIIEQYDQFKKQYDEYMKNGFGKPLFASYSGGRHTKVIENILRTYGIKLARTTTPKSTQEFPISQDMFNINSIQLSDSNCVNQIQSSLKWLGSNQVLVITAHSVSNSSKKTDEYYISEENYKSILNEIASYMQKGLKAWNFKEFWEYITFPHNSKVGTQIIKKESDGEYHKYFKGQFGWIELSN